MKVNLNYKSCVLPDPNALYVGWVTPIDGEYHLIHNPYFCKDYMTDYLRKPTENIPALNYYPQTIPEGSTFQALGMKPGAVNMKEMTFIINLNPEMAARLQTALNCINSLGKKYRMKATKVTPVEFTGMDANNQDIFKTKWYLITASKIWLYNTYLFTIFFSTFRMALQLNVDHYTKVEPAARLLRYGKDIEHLTKYVPKGHYTKVLENLHKIKYKSNSLTGFKDKSLEGHVSVGIFSFFRNKSYFKYDPRWKNEYAFKLIEVLK